MSKKFIAAAVAGLSLIGFSIFSLGNAFALSHEIGDMMSAPLTSSRTLCKEARANYRRDVKNIRAKGLSLHLSEQEIDAEVFAIKDYRIRICNEAAALTSPAKLCSAATKSYRRDVKDARAKGLSLQLSREEINAMVKEVKDYRKKVCKEAKYEYAS